VRARGVPLLAALILLPLSRPLLAQEGTPPPEPPPLTHGLAQLVVDGEVSSLPFASVPQGTLFALAPIVERLGAGLAAAPLGQGSILRLPGREIVVVAGSPAFTDGEQIVPLSVAPADAPAQGGLFVPVDLLQAAWGGLGWSFTWLPGELRLMVERRELRTLELEVDLVHLQGVTTVVLQFPAADPQEPQYRVRTRREAVEVELAGDRLVPPARLPAPGSDPLVEGIEVTPERVRLLLVAEAAAESYVLRNPFRLVFDVFRRSAPEAPAAEVRPPERQPGIRTIVIDPGHGGVETGAIGTSGTAEKDLTLVLAQALKRRLEARLPVRVVLTRDEDADLPLDTRAALANQLKGDLFVSLHLNSSVGNGAHGAETYFLSMQASDAAAASAAAAENAPSSAVAAGEGSGGDPLYDLQLILWDLAQSHHLAESQRLAGLIQEELNTTLSLRDRGVRQAPFRVLMGAAMPAVLVELGFLSNPQEEARLQNPAYRAELVEALVRAITRYRAQGETVRSDAR
jgi:N-acetylmuramoyl-L-alanine amidase